MDDKKSKLNSLEDLSGLRSGSGLVAETSRLELRVLDMRDRHWILELVSGADWIRNIGDRGVRTLADAEAYISRIQDSHARQGYSFYGVYSRETGEGLGICGMTKRDELPLPDLGFAFLPKFYRRGYAYEAAGAVLAHARDVLGMREIAAIVSPGNVGSIRLLEKLDFELDSAFSREFDFRKSETLHYSRKL